MIGEVSENGAFPTTWNARAGARAARKSPMTTRTFGRAPARALSRASQRRIHLVGDDLAGHGREPRGQHPLSGAHLDAQAVRVQPDCPEELPRSLRTAQVVLRELAAPPVGVGAPARNPARTTPAPRTRRP